MEKKSKILITLFAFWLVFSIAYTYYRYIIAGNFLIDESEVEMEISEEVQDNGSGEAEFPVVER